MFSEGEPVKTRNPTLSRCRGPDFVNERYRDFSPTGQASAGRALARAWIESCSHAAALQTAVGCIISACAGLLRLCLGFVGCWLCCQPQLVRSVHPLGSRSSPCATLISTVPTPFPRRSPK